MVPLCRTEEGSEAKEGLGCWLGRVLWMMGRQWLGGPGNGSACVWGGLGIVEGRLKGHGRFWIGNVWQVAGIWELSWLMHIGGRVTRMVGIGGRVTGMDEG